MIRKIVSIDEEKCNGCGQCAAACHEGAIMMVDGKARLIRDDYCDGLGDCLPACPAGAISIIEREAADYSEEAVKAHKAASPLPCACPGSEAKVIGRKEEICDKPASESCLSQWPVQIKLVPVKAPWFDKASLLVAADCTAYAYADFHRKFMKDKITIVGCPKLDAVDYSQKLEAIMRENSIMNVTVVRMEVPCCGGLENAVRKALQASGKAISLSVVTISTDGRILG